jgi:hypothetical protein
VTVNPRLRGRERRGRRDDKKEYTNKEEAKGQRTRSKRQGVMKGMRTM